MKTFARTLPKCSLVGILCCVRDLTFCERRMFLFESVRETVKPFARTLPNRTRTFWQSIFSASFGSDRRFFFFFFFGHCPNFLPNVRNIWSHFGQSVRKTFAYSTTIARACSGYMLIKFTKILRVSFCN